MNAIGLYRLGHRCYEKHIPFIPFATKALNIPGI